MFVGYAAINAPSGGGGGAVFGLHSLLFKKLSPNKISDSFSQVISIFLSREFSGQVFRGTQSEKCRKCEFQLFRTQLVSIFK